MAIDVNVNETLFFAPNHAVGFYLSVEVIFVVKETYISDGHFGYAIFCAEEPVFINTFLRESALSELF